MSGCATGDRAFVGVRKIALARIPEIDGGVQRFGVELVRGQT